MPRSRCKCLKNCHLGMICRLKPWVPHWADAANQCTKTVPKRDRVCPSRPSRETGASSRSSQAELCAKVDERPGEVEAGTHPGNWGCAFLMSKVGRKHARVHPEVVRELTNHLPAQVLLPR